MSHTAHTAPAPFKLIFPSLYDVELDTDEELDVSILPEKHNGVVVPETLQTFFKKIMLVECHDIHEGLPLGWFICLEKIHKVYGKKYKDIIATPCGVMDLVVWFVDESQYSNVGHATPSFIAFDEPDIKAAKKALGGKIKRDTTVTSWW